MNEQQKITNPDYYLIDVNDNEELSYIAAKLGCTIDDIFQAIKEIKTNNRAQVYSWLIDKMFKERTQPR